MACFVTSAVSVKLLVRSFTEREGGSSLGMFSEHSKEMQNTLKRTSVEPSSSLWGALSFPFPRDITHLC